MSGWVDDHTDVVIPVQVAKHNPLLELALDSIYKYTRYPVTLAGHQAVPIGYRSVNRFLPISQGTNGTGAALAIANTDKIMREVCENPEISDPFIWSNDDIFWRRRTTRQELHQESFAARGVLLQLAGRGNGTHSRISRTTAEILDTMNLPSLDYERHVPLVVSKALMLEVLGWMQRPGTAHKRSLYANLNWLRRQQASGRTHVDIWPDVKVWQTIDLPDHTDTRPFFSVSSTFPLEELRSTLRA